MFCKIVGPSSDIHKISEVPKNYADLQSIVLKKFQHEIPSKFFLKYKDSEEELVTLLNDEDLETAVQLSQSDNVKTLRIFVIPHKSVSIASESTLPETAKRQETDPPQEKKLADDPQENKEESNYTYDDPTDSALEELDKELEQIPKVMDLKRSMSHNPQSSTDKAIGGFGYFGSPTKSRFQQASPLLRASTMIPKDVLINSQFNENQIQAVLQLVEWSVKERIDDKIQSCSNELLAKFQEELKNFGLPQPQRGYYSGNQSFLRRTNSIVQEEPQVEACSLCNEQLFAVKYSCLSCPNFRCCEKCENSVDHPHPLLKIRQKGGPAQGQDVPPFGEEYFPSEQSRAPSKSFQVLGRNNPGASPYYPQKPLRPAEIPSQLARYTAYPNLASSTKLQSEGYIPRGSFNQPKNERSIYNFGYQHENGHDSKAKHNEKGGNSSNSKDNKQYKVALYEPPLYEITTVDAGLPYKISFKLKNNGDCQWPDSAKLICVEGNHKNEKVNLVALNPGQVFEVDLHLSAPWETGRFFNAWKVHYMKDGQMKPVGKEISIEIDVVEKREKKRVTKDGQDKEAFGFGGDSEEKRLMKEFDCSEKVLKNAKIIQDLMCSGLLKEKIEFIKSCNKDWDLNEIVSAYLIWINNPAKFKNMREKGSTPHGQAETQFQMKK